MGKPFRGFPIQQASARWWLMLAVLSGGTAWIYLRPGPENARATVLEGATMGTRYRVVLPEPQAEINSLQKMVQAKFDRVVSLMSTYDDSSELSRFNASRSMDPMPVAPETRAVLEIALQVWRRSGGAFDATVGPLVELWGFGPSGRPETMPGDAELAEVRAAVGSDGLKLTAAGLAKDHPETRVDLSAVAKGYAVDLVADGLEAAGVKRYLVEVGGEIRVRGFRQGRDPFRVAIEAPDPKARRVHSVFELTEGAVATSGNYRNFYERDGVKYVHTLSPSTGRPIESRLLSATVHHPSCAWADAWATALMVRGDQAWDLAHSQGLEVLLLMAGPDGTVQEQITPGLAALRVRAPAIAED
jgi:FAD:protein FMN transferase